MAGRQMLSFIPLATSALERQPNLESWLHSWIEASGLEVSILSSEDWFELGHDIIGYEANVDGMDVPITKAGAYVWEPPPAAADVAIQEIRKARHKRQASVHVFVCPRLMKPRWYRQAMKADDLVFELPAGHSCWSTDQHEPLIVVVCFPLSQVQAMAAPELITHFGSGKDSATYAGRWSKSESSVLRQLVLLSASFSTMSQGMVR